MEKPKIFVVYNEKYTMESAQALAGLFNCDCGTESQPCDILIRWGNSYDKGEGRLFDVNFKKGIRRLSTNRKGLPYEIERVKSRFMNDEEMYIVHKKYHMNGVGHLIVFGFQRDLVRDLEFKFINKFIKSKKEYRLIVDRYGNSLWQEKRWLGEWDNPANLLIRTGANGWKYEYVSFKDDEVLNKMKDYIKELDLVVASFDIIYDLEGKPHCVEGNSSPCLSNAKSANFVFKAFKKYIKERLDECNTNDESGSSAQEKSMESSGV